MSDESRNDDVVDLADGSTTSSSSVSSTMKQDPNGTENISNSAAPHSEEPDEEVLELGEHHMVTDAVADAALSSVPAPPVSSAPPAPLRSSQIPMARISLFPPAKAQSTPVSQPVANDDSATEASLEGDAFELQEDHMIQEEKTVETSENESVDHAFDFGSPAMVFDDTDPTNEDESLGGTEEAGSDQNPDNDKKRPKSNLENASEEELRAEAFGGEQPKYAVPFNQPGSGHATGLDSGYAGFGEKKTESTEGAGTEGGVPKRPSVEQVFGDDESSRPSRAPDRAGKISSGKSDVPAGKGNGQGIKGGGAAPATGITVDGKKKPLLTPKPVSLPQGAAESSPVDVEDGGGVELDIDLAEVEVDVEEVTGENGNRESTVKPPPPPSGRAVGSFFKNDKIDAANASLKLQARTARRSRGKKREWWASIFDDEYLMLLAERSPYEQQKQIDFIQRYLGLPPGALLLDLACGNGRNSIGMAQRNYRIVGVDLSLSMLARAGDAAQDAGQKINFIHGDMRDLGFDKTFDGVFSLDTSFGYFDESTNMKVLQGIYRALKPGGTFLLELSNRDFVIRQQPNMVWFQMDNMVCMEETDFNYINNRLYISRQLIIGDNEKQSKHEFSLRLYSLHEIGQLLHQAGFAVIKVSGHRATPGAFFGPESSKLIIIAERRGE